MFNSRFDSCVCGCRDIRIVKEGPIYDPSYVAECPICGVKCRNHGRDEEEARLNWNEWIMRRYHLQGYRG